MRYRNKMLTSEDAELSAYLAAVRVLFEQKPPAQEPPKKDDETTEDNETH